jgi:hypothetical protein
MSRRPLPKTGLPPADLVGLRLAVPVGLNTQELRHRRMPIHLMRALLPIQSPAEPFKQPLEIAESHILKVSLLDSQPQPFRPHSLKT